MKLKECDFTKTNNPLGVYIHILGFIFLGFLMWELILEKEKKFIPLFILASLCLAPKCLCHNNNCVYSESKEYRV